MRKEALEKLKEKAEKWDIVEEIAISRKTTGGCAKCPLYNQCKQIPDLVICGSIIEVVNALEGEVKG